MMVTREFARDHGLVLPDGYFKDKAERAKNSQLSLYEMHQQRATGLSKEDRMEQVTDAWRASDSARAFVQALAARGYILATGKRPYVLVDLYGKMNALPKLIADKTIRTKDIRKFLGKEFPPESLPSTEEAKVLITKHRKSVEAHLKSEQRAEAMKALERSQSARRQEQEKDWKALQQRQHKQRHKLGATNRAQRDVHRADYLAQTRHLRRERDQKRRAGLAAFLARVSGVALIQNKLHKYQDKKRLHVFMEEKAGLKEKQQQERTGLQRRQEMQSLDMNRKIRALEHVEKRELKSLEESLKRDARIQARGGRSQIPALALELRPPGRKEDLYKAKRRYISNLACDPSGQDHFDGQETKQIELSGDFEQAEAGKTKQIDLESEFTRAAKDRDEEEEGGSSEGPKPASKDKIKRYGRKRGRDKDFDRER